MGSRPRLLLVGGGGGLVGRSVLPELLTVFRVRSVHRHRAANEPADSVEWVADDAGKVRDWRPLLREVDVVVNLAWYRWGSEREFSELYGGLSRLITAAQETRVPRFIQLSVPSAPPEMEQSLPYLAYKRRVDTELANSGLSYRILRPTMLFGPGDVLLTVMLRTMHRYGVFPMFGDGAYHASPIAVADVARLVRLAATGAEVGTVDLGGPRRFAYRELTDALFRALGQRPRYVRLSERGSVRLAALLQSLGSTLLYAYEVEWLLSDRLGLRPAVGLDRELTPVEPFLAEQARRLTRRS